MEPDRISCSRLLSRALELAPEKLTPSRRGFSSATSPVVRAKLDAVVRSFAQGYNCALGSLGPEHLASLPHELRGFAVEGAAMSSALLDLITFSGGRRVARLARTYDRLYTHLIHVGVGWAFARLHRRPWSGIGSGQPLLRWLAWDGWGFHQAYFHPRPVFERQRIERLSRADIRPIRDQGVGRALWFYAAAEPALIAAVIARFPPERQCDLWAGIGLAAGYTAAQPAGVLDELVRAAGGFRDHLAQGAAFAAKAHLLSGAVPPASADCVEALTGAAVITAAEWTDQSFTVAAARPDNPMAYQAWRAAIRDAFSKHNKGVSL